MPISNTYLGTQPASTSGGGLTQAQINALISNAIASAGHVSQADINTAIAALPTPLTQTEVDARVQAGLTAAGHPSPADITTAVDNARIRNINIANRQISLGRAPAADGTSRDLTASLPADAIGIRKWTANTAYQVDDLIWLPTGQNSNGIWACATANTDAIFNSANWNQVGITIADTSPPLYTGKIGFALEQYTLGANNSYTAVADTALDIYEPQLFRNRGIGAGSNPHLNFARRFIARGVAPAIATYPNHADSDLTMQLSTGAPTPAGVNFGLTANANALHCKAIMQITFISASDLSFNFRAEIKRVQPGIDTDVAVFAFIGRAGFNNITSGHGEFELNIRPDERYYIEMNTESTSGTSVNQISAQLIFEEYNANY